MNIKVEINQNIIFFELLIHSSKRKYDKYHDIASEVLNEFENISELSSFKEFKQKYESNEFGHDYKLIKFAINTNSDLTPKELSPKDGWGPNSLKYYTDEIYTLVVDIYNKLDFDKRFKEKVVSKFDSIKQDIQKIFDINNPIEVLKEFWKFPYEPTFIFIPDPFRRGQGFSVSRDSTSYSISGTIGNEGHIIFEPNHFIPNLLHEYSHDFFREYLDGSSYMFERNNILCHTLEEILDKELVKDFNSVSHFMEENFITAVQTLLSQRYFAKKWSEEKSKEIAQKILDEKYNNGYIYVREFYESIQKNEDPVEGYIKVLEELTKKK